MKQLQLVTLAAALAFLVGCETTNETGMGNQERKRMDQIQREHAEAAQLDESDVNLWNSEQRRIVNQSNPAIKY
jgi:uncharacterized protein YcfL